VADGALVLETEICDAGIIGPDGRTHPIADYGHGLDRTPIARFLPGDELNGDPSNWWVPNITCVEEMVSAAGFDLAKTLIRGNRVCVHADKNHNRTPPPDVAAVFL